MRSRHDGKLNRRLNGFSSWIECAVSLRVGHYRINALYWGYLGNKWWRNYLHTHSFFEVCYAVGGKGTFRTMEKDLPVKGGELFLAKPGDTHEIISARRTSLQIYFWAFTLVPAGGGGVREAEQSVNRLLDAFIVSSRRTGAMSDSIRPILGMLTDEDHPIRRRVHHGDRRAGAETFP